MTFCFKISAVSKICLGFVGRRKNNKAEISISYWRQMSLNRNISSFPFKWPTKKIATILIATSNWVIEKNSSVKSLNEACLRVIDSPACDMRLIEKIAFILLASRLSGSSLELQHFLSVHSKSFLFICSRSFSNSLTIDTKVKQVASLQFSLSLTQWGTAGSKIFFLRHLLLCLFFLKKKSNLMD